MKTLLVTSQITYVPSNGLDLLDETLRTAHSHIAGLVLLSNLSPKLAIDLAGLAALGATRIATTLLRNLLELPLHRRERLAASYRLPVLRFSSMNSPEAIQYVRNHGIDLIVNARTRCIYKAEILSAPRLGCINIHHGLLPEYRGTLCDLYALHEGRPAGFTIHEMNAKIDAGRILVRRAVSELGEQDFVAYLRKAGRIEGQTLASLIQDIAKTDQLPPGEVNACVRPIYTRNPGRGRIREMRKAGMIL